MCVRITPTERGVGIKVRAPVFQTGDKNSSFLPRSNFMNRRNFLSGLATLIGGVAIEAAIPFNRVYSFPSKVVVPYTYIDFDKEYARLVTVYYEKPWMDNLRKQTLLLAFSENRPLPRNENKSIKFVTYNFVGA